MLLLMAMLIMVLLWQVKLRDLLLKKETCEEILKDLYYGAAKVIKAEAARWQTWRNNNDKTAFYLLAKELKNLVWQVICMKFTSCQRDF